MPTLKITLPDINVWLALVWDRHVHHRRAREWFEAVTPGGAAFCRVTQMGLLRLLTNSKVMRDDVLSQRSAWAIYDLLTDDPRVVFALEPPEIELVWKKLTQRSSAATSLWTDAYIAALALAHGFHAVSFDQGLRRIPGLNSTIL